MAIDFARQLVARWPEPEAAHLPLLKRAGIEAILVPGAPAAGFAGEAKLAGIEVAPESALTGAVTRGLWPGIRRPGQQRTWANDLFASASLEPWIDSNLYLTPLERALTSKPSPVIAYQAGPEAGLTAERPAPFESLEIALLEARMQGANFILSIDPRYRAALLQEDAKALAAWDSLGRTAVWLRQNSSQFGLVAPPTITLLVEPGAATAELANLLYRRNGSPTLAQAAAPPPPDPRGILLLVAASLKVVPESVWRHAEAGSTVAIDNPALIKPAWKRVKEEPDREFYSAAKGNVIVYRKRISEPSEFALDMIDVVGHRLRTARLWNALSAVAFATAGPATNEMLLHIINYGSVQEEEVQARIHGHFKSATLLRPEAPPSPLKAGPRGLATEVFLPNLKRAAVIRFQS